MGQPVDACLAALDHPDVLDAVSQTPFGEKPMDQFLGAVWVDPMTHAWDIADAAGIGHGIDPETAARAKAGLEPVAEMMRSGGMLGREVQTSSDDAVTQTMAFAGRTSVRS